jgi:hypothetical protein
LAPTADVSAQQVRARGRLPGGEAEPAGPAGAARFGAATQRPASSVAVEPLEALRAHGAQPRARDRLRGLYPASGRSHACPLPRRSNRKRLRLDLPAVGIDGSGGDVIAATGATALPPTPASGTVVTRVTPLGFRIDCNSRANPLMRKSQQVGISL